MKKLLFFTIIGLFAVSCQPAEVTCDCTGTGGTGGGSVTVSGGLSLIDTNLIGHWKNSNPLVNLATGPLSSAFSPVTDFDIYFSPDGLVYMYHTFSNGTDTIYEYEIADYKVIDEGILCMYTEDIIQYEINNGVFTYYNDLNYDFEFNCYKVYTSVNPNLSFWNNYPDASLYNQLDYFVKSNSLTKQ